MTKIKLIVGIGNPDQEYQNTRHNIGFMALDSLLEKFEPVEKTFWEEKKNLKSNIKHIKFSIQDPRSKIQDLILAKPTTFMNASGFAVSKVLNYYKIEPVEMIVIHDDSDLLLGKIRVRFGGGSGGHKGVASIIETIQTDQFLRVRLGIGRSEDEKLGKKRHKKLDRYVLGSFSPAERGHVKTMIREATRAVELILEHGLEVYMSKYNK